MKVIRKQTIDTKLFELGDEIRFKLKTSEKVRAKAVQETPEGMLFITKDCVGKEKRMYEDVVDDSLDYMGSDLRKYLNTDLINLFPDKIRERMLPMEMSYGERDYLRIPTEKEIFGENKFGKAETNSKRFYGMKHRKNRMAFEHTNGEDVFERYWLQNAVEVSGAGFAFADEAGNANYDSASYFYGVRLVFLLY
jgi:hypothetical protein